MVVRQRADEEEFEIAVFAGDDHVLAADQGDHIVLLENGFVGARRGEKKRDEAQGRAGGSA